VKLLNSDGAAESRWVVTTPGRGFGSREEATVFPDREAADPEAEAWMAMKQEALSVVVEAIEGRRKC
jgi:hypothetical protein